MGVKREFAGAGGKTANITQKDSHLSFFTIFTYSPNVTIAR